MKTTQELVPSLKPVFDRYKSGDILSSAFGSKQGITSKKFWSRPSKEQEKALGIIPKGSNPELFFAFNKDGKKYRQYKSKFFNSHPEALADMASIISSNPNSWPDLLKEKYGIQVDDQFWENNPLGGVPPPETPLRGGVPSPETPLPGGLTGEGIDIHKQILKVAPKKGFTLPGHKYTGPGNPLEEQLRYDPNTDEILEIYEQPAGPTDAVSMQHDVDYSVCANKPKGEQVSCKNAADRKMVKALDAIPWSKRQWSHAMARTMINTKQKLGMGVGGLHPPKPPLLGGLRGVKQSKNVRRR